MNAKTFWILLLMIVASFSAGAQRFALVDVNKILDNLEEYRSAQAELDRIAAGWKQEIAVEYDKIKALYNKYQAEQVLMTEEQRRGKEEEIASRGKEARRMQKEKFGEDGELFKRRQDLVRPIQDKVYTAIQEYATANGLDAIFDTSGTAGILYFNKELDRTEVLLKKLKTN